MAEYSEVFEYFLQKFLPIWQKSVVPLYKTAAEPGHLPDFVGSSVYCRFGRSLLLLTAGHVLKDIMPGSAIYPLLLSPKIGPAGSRGPMISGSAQFRGIPSEKWWSQKNDGEDAGIIELKDPLGSIWTPLRGERFARFDEREEYQHVLLGYPGSSVKGWKPDEQSIRIMGYLTSAAPAGEYAAVGAQVHQELVVLFKRQKVYGQDQSRVTFPDPHGMSGGPVVQFHEKSPRVQSLVGILTEWHGDSIVATRIETITRHFRVVRIDP
jgi:hypothetical protein